MTIFTAGKKSLIVVVDDQSTGRKILERLLCSIEQDVEVVAFDSATVAMDFIRSTTPDLIVTDYLMPEMDGVSFIRSVRGLTRCTDVPIIVVTVVDDVRIRYQALDAGATDFINRPIDQHECRARCKNLLALRRQGQIISSRAKWLEEQVALATKQVLAREQETLLRLARAGEYRDEHTGSHVMRIAKYSRLLAETLGLPAPECEAIELASPMHDIGKIGIPDHILLKPAKLTQSELAVMRGHSRLGYEILRDSPSHYLQLGAIIAHYHHEKFDGSGYPEGLSEEAIPLSARIVAVVDVFDALTSARPYKAPWSNEAVMAHIQSLAGSHFDPRCVEAFSARIPDIERVRAQLRDHDRLHEASAREG